MSKGCVHANVGLSDGLAKALSKPMKEVFTEAVRTHIDNLCDTLLALLELGLLDVEELEGEGLVCTLTIHEKEDEEE